jgi:4-hydroxy-tetrahydrodipicolinate synthase
MSGVLCPVITPFMSDLSPDPDRLIRQCQWLLSQNVGLAVFGTNSEANSLSLEEKMLLLDRLVDAGIDTNRMMPGTGCCALTETVALTKHAVKLGCAGTLMLPPFYYKDVSDDGLFASFAEVIERVGSSSLRIYLYHIPPISQVGISLDLIDRLVKAYPQTVVGIKDSSGDWNNTNAMLERRWDDFRVFAGAETFLLQNMRGGGAGCISATANINPAAIDHLFQEWQSAEAEPRWLFR